MNKIVSMSARAACAALAPAAVSARVRACACASTWRSAARIVATPSIRFSSSSGSGKAAVTEDGSHPDFAPQSRPSAANPSDPTSLRAQVDEIVRGHKVVVFMKGTPSAPACGFSASMVRLLHAYGVECVGVDILTHAALRSFMKEYSEWPTFPQLYVDGKFIGGRDIAVSLHESGELAKILGKPAPASV